MRAGNYGGCSEVSRARSPTWFTWLVLAHPVTVLIDYYSSAIPHQLQFQEDDSLSVTQSVDRWCSWSKNFILFLWHVTANRKDGFAVSQRGNDLVSAVPPERGCLCLRVRARRAGFGAVPWRKCQIVPLSSRLTINDSELFPCQFDYSSSSRMQRSVC